MEEESIIQARRRPTKVPLPSGTSPSSSRISSSQSYFDVYPERRNRTSQRLKTSSSLKSQPNSEGDEITLSFPSRDQIIPQRSPLVSCNRQETLDEDGISSSNSNSKLTVSSESAHVTPSSSSSSSSASSFFSKNGINPIDPHYGRLSKAQPSPRFATLTSLSKETFRYKNSHIQDETGRRLESVDGAIETETNKDQRKKSSAVRLKSQKSMPNVKTRTIKHLSPDVQGFSWLTSSRQSSNFKLNDKILEGKRPACMHSSSTDPIQSQGGLSFNSEDEDENSDSSLDSVGKEARSTLRNLMRPAGDSISQMLQKTADQDDESAPKAFQRKMQSTADRILPSSKSRSKRYPSDSHANIRNDRTPSPGSHSIENGKEVEEEAIQIQQYIKSKRITTLMTLSQAPYHGKMISLADVGNSNGHPVFVFLGLGAVRYLAGLYDEMANVLGLRLICIDRWGQGKTDDISADQRGVLEWSGVVIEVADRLGIDTFSILAHSAGAPYAMATTLMHSNRIAGPVHLLAPWVSPTIENGYKWLRYIPDGVIKTAQAADWRMQAWKLGLTRIAPIDHSQSRDESETIHSYYHDNSSSNSSTHSTHSIPPSQSEVNNLRKTLSRVSIHDDERSNSSLYSNNSSTNSAPAKDVGQGQQIALPHSITTNSGLNRLLDASDSPLLRRTLLQQKSLALQSRPRPVTMGRSFSDYTKANAPNKTKIDKIASTSPKGNNLKSSADLATALLKASHTENLVSGGGNDLLVILGRSSQKPWGFSYTDIRHPVNVWYGDKDERINITSILWMQKEMSNCSINIVKGASHDLMTNVAVMVEALESITMNRHN